MDSIVRVAIIRYLDLQRKGLAVKLDKTLTRIKLMMSRAQYSQFRREIRIIGRER